MPKKSILILAAVLAPLAAVLLPAQSAPTVKLAEPVPTCVKPTSSPTPEQMVDYAQCLQSRTEALIANAHPPAPTVTETVTVTASPTPSPAPTSSTTPTADPSPAPTSSTTPTADPSPTSTSNPTPIGIPSAGDFPTEDSVGPVTEPTAIYSGSCTVTTDNLVIENAIVNCPGGLIMGNANGNEAPDRMVQGVMIRNSVVNGGVSTDTRLVDYDTAIGNDNAHPEIFRVESSRLLCAAVRSECRAVGMAHFTVIDSYLLGTHSGMWAHNNAVIEDSFITTTGTSTHQSGLRMLKNSTLRGNTILCNPAGIDRDGGCSADAVFYREFGVPGNLTIEGNYFRRGASQGQWFATRFTDCQLVDVCVDIKMVGNLFDLGQGTDGGEFPDDTGDVWSDNWWTDGIPALSNQARG